MASTVSPASLAAAFAELSEPRRIASVISPLPAILAMTVAALVSGCLSVLAIAERGAGQAPELLAALGFPTAETPCQSTLQRLFAKLDGAALGAATQGVIRWWLDAGEQERPETTARWLWQLLAPPWFAAPA